MSEKFTPGTWEAYGSLVVAYGEHGATICEMSEPRSSQWAQHVRVKLGSEDASEAHANQRLILAAKDFYAAAKAICDRHDERARAANFAGCGCEDCTPFRAALKKAVGE